MGNDLKQAFLDLGPSIDELTNSFNELKNIIPKEEIKYIPVEISKLDIHNGDTILLTFDLNECDIETIKNTFKMWKQIIPSTINIITVIKPIVESVQIIHNKEEKPF